MSDSESNRSESGDDTSESSSEGEEIVDVVSDKDFFKTLSFLKNKDPRIYDKNVQFFNKSTEVGVKKINQEPKNIEKPVFVKDYVVGLMDGDSDEEDSSPKQMTYAEEQQATKQFFKNELENNSSSEDESEGLMKIKVKSEKDQKEEDADYIQFLKGNKSELGDKDEEKELKPLCEFWNKKDLDEGEEFLKDYILNRKYLSKDSLTVPNIEDLSEDERVLEEQAEFEDKYNRRFETEDNLAIRRFPRNIEGSLRRKDDSRRSKRAEIALRKKEEKEKKRGEIKKKQKEVLVEIEERYKEIENLTQNPELGVEDFDPEAYDKKMSECFNEDFYNQEEDNHPTFNEDDYNGWDYEEINMDCEANKSQKESKKLTRSKKKKMNKKKAFTDIMEIAKPSFDPEVHNDFKEYFDKYYNLDCEDFIDDLPCRYKYNEVVPNDFGLTVEEILMADDSELNTWASLKKISKIRPVHVEKNEVKVYSKKAQNEYLKRKILPSLFSNENEDQSESKETTNDLISFDSSNIIGKKETKKSSITQDKYDCNQLEATGSNIQSEIDSLTNKNDNDQLDIKPKNDLENFEKVNQENRTESKKKRKKKSSNNLEMSITENSEISLDRKEKPCDENSIKSKSCLNPKNDVQKNFNKLSQGNRTESRKNRKRKHSNDHEMSITENSEISLDQKEKPCNENNKEVGKNDAHNGNATCGPKKKRRKKKPIQKNVDLSSPKDKTNIATDSVQQNSPAQLKSKHHNKNKKPNNWRGRSSGDVTKLSDDRLRAYGFKPKQFRAKMKYSKTHQAPK